MSKYHFSNVGKSPKLGDKNRVMIHRSAFREVTHCRNCNKELSTFKFGKATGLCSICVNKLRVTCPICKEIVLVVPRKKANHKCFETIPIRAWRECVLAGTFLSEPRKEC